MQRLRDAESAGEAARRISGLVKAHAEWLCAGGGERAVSLRRDECDFRVSGGRLVFSCRGESGSLSWRVKGWEWTGEKLLLEASRRMGAERALLELTPRAHASAAYASVTAARLEGCRRLAELARACLPGAKVERAGLSPGPRGGQPGRYARIMLLAGPQRVAVTGIVGAAHSGDVDAFLSSSILWFARVSERGRRLTARKLWLVASAEWAGPLSERLALLRNELRSRITLRLMDDGRPGLAPAESPGLDEILARRPARFRRAAEAEAVSETARRIMALAPEAIDVLRSRHGETLRYNGLAFARVRRVMNREGVWFGAEGARSRRLLCEDAPYEWERLLRGLKEHRRADAPDRRHMLYRAAPEAWLETLLRRDITRLDPGLRLAPLHAQFRPWGAAAGSRPVDLLALRRDGRLAVIELKVAEDREHVLQGADYWRRVEAHRLAGHIARSKIFGEAEISDEPPLVYLVAPVLRFHSAFALLAGSVNPAIEIYRFDINEDWRSGVRVLRRALVSGR